jgi:hypothetical protein
VDRGSGEVYRLGGDPLLMSDPRESPVVTFVVLDSGIAFLRPRHDSGGKTTSVGSVGGRQVSAMEMAPPGPLELAARASAKAENPFGLRGGD